MTKAAAEQHSSHELDPTEFVRLEGKVDALVKGMSEFVVETRQRITQIENDQSTALQRIADEQRNYGKVNWTAIAVIATLVGTVALLYISPVKTEVDALKQQIALEASALDQRLQREMRQLNDVIIAQANGTKENMSMRIGIDERRIDDVTNRVDRRADDERQELIRLRERVYGPQTQPR